MSWCRRAFTNQHHSNSRLACWMPYLPNLSTQISALAMHFSGLTFAIGAPRCSRPGLLNSMLDSRQQVTLWAVLETSIDISNLSPSDWLYIYCRAIAKYST